MSKATKKKDKVPKITEEQYAEYISALKSSQSDTEQLCPDRNMTTKTQNDVEE